MQIAMTSPTHQALVQHTQGRGEPRLASPDTLGLWAFALGTFVGNLPDTGGVARTGLATCVAVFLGGGAQLLAGLQEYRTRNVFGATSFTAFGLFWITIGVSDWLTGMHLLPPTDHVTLGWYLACWTVFAFILFGATPALNRALEIAVGLSGVGLLAKAIGAFGNLAVFTRVGAWLLIACATAAAYTATAQFWNTVHRRNVLPLGDLPRPHVRSHSRPPASRAALVIRASGKQPDRPVQTPSSTEAPKCPWPEESR
ncbi:acetate uptake transporter [Streptomyces dubilierae]|uniref:Acetate uptake transporter n=1 Tax=Streptomyces dubilierae TaxID=3075533 RepID=A0ABU2P1Q9_9ACTN|nr:acetate uptake transporter [Streptomyces sp. DSM 41921]MDT0386076.1 acetate uptake transporter [Streptomyces sp. DSM 41921]